MKKRRLTFNTITALTVLALICVALSISTPASANGATQISGIGYADITGDCVDPEGQSSDYATIMTGDLQGCVYTFVETYSCMPSGLYQETGTETFVGHTSDTSEAGTFRTNYRFTAKYQDCPNLITEIKGRCQHPIIAGSGTEFFEGITGRLDFKDDIEAGNFPYRGHLK